MTINDMIENYVDDMTLEEVIQELLKYDVVAEYPMLDDDYPDWEDEIRVRLVDLIYEDV